MRWKCGQFRSDCNLQTLSWYECTCSVILSPLPLLEAQPASVAWPRSLWMIRPVWVFSWSWSDVGMLWLTSGHLAGHVLVRPDYLIVWLTCLPTINVWKSTKKSILRPVYACISRGLKPNVCNTCPAVSVTWHIKDPVPLMKRVGHHVPVVGFLLVSSSNPHHWTE